MANPRLPGISENEQALLYAKLNEYNRGRASFKRRRSVYLGGVPPTGETKLFPLALFSPARKQSILYIHDLSPDINESPADGQYDVLLFETLPYSCGL